MAELTGIEWTDHTFNPWWGCEKVSPGCARCYAEGEAHRRQPTLQLWGPGHGFKLMAESTWEKPLAWDRESARQGRVRFGGRPDERIRVFCASMADVFEDRDELTEPRARLFDLIRQTPHLDWQILTKRPDVAKDELAFLYDYLHYDILEPSDPLGYLPNVWLGVSIENARFTWRADVLREIPAAVRFISAEPLLGSLFVDDGRPHDWSAAKNANGEWHARNADRRKKPLDLTGIDWVIVGGESGRGARPMHPDWAREIRDACLDDAGRGHSCDHCRLDRKSSLDAGHWAPCARPAFFFKQWGEWAPGFDTADRTLYVGREGGPGYAYEFAPPGAAEMRRVGKKSAGRELDGRTWDEFPRRRRARA